MDHNDILGEIKIAPNNTMRATYSIIGVGSSDILAEIEIRAPKDSDRNAEIEIRAIGEYHVDAEIDIKYGGYSDVLAEIQPVGHVNISAELTVRPGNKMSALYEIQQPPKLTAVYEPFKDSFTRANPEYSTINYGYNSSLTVGRTPIDEYTSYVQFNLSNWHPLFTIINTKLRLHYTGVLMPNAQLELYTVDEYWAEHGITYANSPRISKLVIDEYENYPSEGYIEFELTDTVVDWVKGSSENHGVMVRLADENDNYTATFRSRESNRPPELIITYYDSRIYSAGRSQVLAEIFVWRTGESGILAEIEVDSVIGNSDILAEMYVHRYEVPLLEYIPAEITVTREKVDAELTVSIQDDSSILAEITSRVETARGIDAEIIVSKPFLYAEIYVAHQDIVDAELTVQRHDDSDRDAEISVTREAVLAELYVKHENGILAEIEIQRKEENTIPAEITVTREFISSEIYVKHRNDIDAEITVLGEDESVINSELTVTREYVYGEIVARVSENSELDADIYIRAIDESVVPAEVSITRESVLAEITVTEYVDVEAEIFVKYTDSINAEIDIRVTSSVLAEIDIKKTSSVPSEITITRLSVDAIIIVPYWDDSDILAEIQPRILQASDRFAEILVRGGNQAYAFII